MKDLHIHIGRSEGKRLAEPFDRSLRVILENYARLGITELRDGGDDLSLGLIARELSPEYGISFTTPVVALSRSGGYGAFLGRGAGSAADIAGIISALLKKQPDFIKIIQSGICSFDTFGEVTDGGFERELYTEIAAAACGNGLKIMVHVNGGDNIMRALEWGADSIEHGYYITERELRVMAGLGTIWVPTLAPLVNYLAHCEPSDRQAGVLAEIIGGHEAAIKSALALGVKVEIGSDSGAMYVGHGQGTLDEIQCLQRAGMEI